MTTGMNQRPRPLARQSIRTRLVIGIALVHAVLMTLFITDLVHRQRQFMRTESGDRAQGLAQMVAVNSVSWVLAHDVHGLAEVMGSVKSDPMVLWAMVIDRDGKVLGHTDGSRIEHWLVDGISRELLAGPAEAHQIFAGAAMLEAAAPIRVEGRVIGWARVALNLSGQAVEMRGAVIEGLLYTAGAILVGTLFALWIAKRLTADLVHLGKQAERLRAGERHLHPLLRPPAEIANLESTFGAMADTILARQDELVRSTDKLRSSNAELERFNEVLAHHLQEPVRLQSAYTQRLQKLLPAPLPDEAQEALSYVLKGALRLRQLLHDAQRYLTFNQLPPAARPCSAEQAADAAIAGLDAEIRAAGARVERGELPEVMLDHNLLAEVFSILLSNAITYAGDIPPVIRIDGHLEKAGLETEGLETEGALLSVSDNGVGIPEKFRERVFVMFERLDPARGAEGTGLGLALAKKIVEAAQGRIWIEALAEGGTRICFTLPTQEHEQETEYKPSGSNRSPGNGNG